MNQITRHRNGMISAAEWFSCFSLTKLDATPRRAEKLPSSVTASSSLALLKSAMASDEVTEEYVMAIKNTRIRAKAWNANVPAVTKLYRFLGFFRRPSKQNIEKTRP